MAPGCLSDLDPILPIPNSILHCKEPCRHLILHFQTPPSALDHPGPGRKWDVLYQRGCPWEERPEKETFSDFGNGFGVIGQNISGSWLPAGNVRREFTMVRIRS